MATKKRGTTYLKKIRKAVKRYIKNGWKPIPVDYQNKKPINSGWSEICMKKSEINNYFSRDCNIGILMGKNSNNLVDIDLDSFSAINMARYILPKTIMFGHKSKPVSHWLYRVNKEIKTTKYSYGAIPGQKDDNKNTIVEIRSTGSQTVFPPSIHESSEKIKWDIKKGKPTQIFSEDLENKVKKLAAACLLVKFWIRGSRQNMSLAVAGGLLRAKWDKDEVKKFISIIAREAGDEEIENRLSAVDHTAEKITCDENATGLPTLSRFIDDGKVMSKITEWLNIGEYYNHYPLTDIGNAERLVDTHGIDLHYCNNFRKWFIWNGKYWEKDTSGEIERRAKDSIRRINILAETIKDNKFKESLKKHVYKSESDQKIKAMINRAMAENGIHVQPNELDANNYLLNCGNGTLDLINQRFSTFTRRDLITKIIPVEYDENAKCPKWKNFLKKIFDNDKKLISFIKRAVGYSLTGDVTEDCMFILYGTGRNGKSTFISIISALLGEYGQSVRAETLLVKKFESIPNDIARMKGARFVSAVEAEKGKRLGEAQIKSLTGGDKQTARFLFKEFFDFIPTAKIWLAVNDKPIIRGNDPAIWARIRLIPFSVTISEEERIRGFAKQIIQEELPGVLVWAVKGCNSWHEKGLGMPKAVKRATKLYRTEMSVVARFIEEYCVVKSGGKTQLRDLYNKYAEWCKSNGEYQMIKREFQWELEKCGYDKAGKKGRGTHGFVEYVGLKLIQQDVD